MIPEGFLEGDEYVICYEARTNIIVSVEKYIKSEDSMAVSTR